ncbi:MAG: CcmD family protein [Ignavibacteria bacterium]|nr:CcmD family protein [Ignavibacteria bacterium]
MIDFLTLNALYVVLICALIIWAGIAFYLLRVDRKISQLERRLNRYTESKKS